MAEEGFNRKLSAIISADVVDYFSVMDLSTVTNSAS